MRQENFNEIVEALPSGGPPKKRDIDVMETTDRKYRDRLEDMLSEIKSWPAAAQAFDALTFYCGAIKGERDRWHQEIRERALLDREAEIAVRAQRITQAVWDLYEGAYVYMENRKVWEDLLSTFERAASKIREELEGVPLRVIMEPERIERRLDEMCDEIHGWCRTPEFYRAVYEFWYVLECLWDSGPRYDDEERDCCHENQQRV
jgi:hypothetical protein